MNVYRHPDLLGNPLAVTAALARKCEFVGIAVPNAESFEQSSTRIGFDAEWANMLAHQLPHLPAVDAYWRELPAVFAWLNGAQLPTLARVTVGANVDPDWSPPRAFTTWKSGARMELIRFAGANRLLIDIDYRAEDGRWGRRVVEPYSVRRTREGNLLLFVVNDRGQLRSYRLDRIAGVRVVDQTFRPRFIVEF